MTDVLHRFSFPNLPVRGQWVRLTACVAAANQVHDYPEPIRNLLNQMFAAVAMFADNLKFSGAVSLQSQGDGAVVRTLTECRDRQYLRGIAHLREDAQPPQHSDDLAAWLGTGRLALTLIPPPDTRQATYQGLVQLEHPELSSNLEAYLASSEQLPSRLFLASNSDSVTGLLVQRLPSADHATEITLQQEEEAWHTIVTLADTVTEEELLQLTPDELLRRLFNEYPPRLHPGRILQYRCTCSRQKSDRTLRVLGDDDVRQLLQEQGQIHIDCEFCGKRYNNDEVDVGALLSGTPTRQSSTRH